MIAHRRRDRGFTFVELMVAIAIISVLATVALPTYIDHVSRTQIARVHVELSHYRNAIEQFLASGDLAPLAADTAGAVDFVDSDISTVTFGTFADVASSTITATLDGSASAAIRGTVVALSRTAEGTWHCDVTGAGGRWSDKFIPASCD